MLRHARRLWAVGLEVVNSQAVVADEIDMSLGKREIVDIFSIFANVDLNNPWQITLVPPRKGVARPKIGNSKQRPIVEKKTMLGRDADRVSVVGVDDADWAVNMPVHLDNTCGNGSGFPRAVRE